MTLNPASWPEPSAAETSFQNVVRAEFIYKSKQEEKQGFGTGFILSVKKPVSSTKFDFEHWLVTNRHNIDYFGMQPQKNTDDFVLTSIELEFRHRVGGARPEISQASIKGSARILVDVNPGNDVALVELLLEPKAERSRYITANFTTDIVADDRAFDSLPIGIPVFFVGFPGGLWDWSNHLPIYRQAVIASFPHLNYSSSTQGEALRVLVSGLSLSGSSGSPVFAKGKNVDVLVGVMTGHFPETSGSIENLNWAYEPIFDSRSKEERSAGLHSGLSYFIKASAIHKILSSGKPFAWGPTSRKTTP